MSTHRESVIESADEWLNKNRVSETWRIMSALRDELVRAPHREELADNLDRLRESPSADRRPLHERVKSLLIERLGARKGPLMYQVIVAASFMLKEDSPDYRWMQELREENLVRFAYRTLGTTVIVHANTESRLWEEVAKVVGISCPSTFNLLLTVSYALKESEDA